MSRPSTDTVSYFPHDTDAQHKKTLTIIRGQFGLEGVGFWWSLLEWLGATEGYYYNGQQPQDLEFLLQKLGISVQVGIDILNKLAYLNAIDPILWSHKVIYSQNFVKRIETVYDKRKRETPKKPCFCDENCDHSLITNNITEPETLIFSPVMPQSKESKVKKVNKSKENMAKNLETYKLSLKEKYPLLSVDDEWIKCQTWYSDNGKQIKSPSLALMNWMEIAEQKRLKNNGKGLTTTQSSKYAGLMQR